VSGTQRVVDSHVHYWDPEALEHPWLEAVPALRRAFGPEEYRVATAGVPVEGVIFVEGNPRSDAGAEEARWVEALSHGNLPLLGIVAFADLTAPAERRRAALDELAARPLVRGVRHNIQGNPPGFATAPGFVEGVREAGERSLVFDLCVTHDQLAEATGLVDRCPGTRFVLDHCAKPAIGEGRLDPWRDDLARLAERPGVACKLSGLTTEAGASWRWEDLLPYAEHVVSCFGPGRLLYGSDWPVLTLASDPAAWYDFTRSLTAGWSAAERAGFYGENARAVYGLPARGGSAPLPDTHES
jgi:L-fuconolactonase